MPTRLHPLRNLLARPGEFRRGRDGRFALGVFFILAVLCSPAAAQTPNDLKRAQEIYEKALQEKKTTSRLDLLQKAAKLGETGDPATLSTPGRRQIALIHWALGREYFQQTKWPAAVGHLEKAVAIDATLFSAYATLGLIYFQQKKYAEAIAAYNQALPAQPSAQLYNNLGAAQEARGDLPAALAAYRRALELEPNLIPAQKNLHRVQEKLALSQPAPALETKIAAIDSAQLAAARRDSLAAVAQKNNSKLSKNKTPPGLKSARNKTAEINKTSIAEKNKKEASSHRAKPASAVETTPTAPLRLPIKKKEALAVNSLARIDTIAKEPVPANKNLTAPKPRPTAATQNASGHPVFAYLCGAGVLLCGLVIFTQRRRLSHIWLQIRPASAAPEKILMPEERLLPAIATPHQFEVKKVESQTPVIALSAAVAFNEGRAIMATAESKLALETENEETHQPSLQTQAFFAEMIAAEPELENFELEIQEEAADCSMIPPPSNEHSDSVLLVAVNGFAHSEGAVQALTSSPIVVSAVELNKENGHTILSPLQTEILPAVQTIPAVNQQLPGLDYLPQETSKQLSVITYPQPEIDTRAKPHADSILIEKPALGRYQIEREIGKGAMGKIYLARDPKLDRRVVIKTVCFNLAASEADTTTIKDRVYREARAIAKLSHPHIVVVYNVEDKHDLSYIVMEHIEGRDLRQALKTEHRFEAERAVKIIAQVCSALDYAHQAGIIHRDIKPSNIMLLPNDKAKVTDFGIAKIADNFSLTLPGHVLGTPSYMAPEQFEEETADSRADIFSLGVVLYELLSGARPFAADSLAALAYKIVHKMHIPPSLQNVELPLELDDIIGCALAKNPAERYQTAQEFRDALLAVKFAPPA